LDNHFKWAASEKRVDICPIGTGSLVYTIYEGWNFNSGNYLFTTDTK